MSRTEQKTQPGSNHIAVPLYQWPPLLYRHDPQGFVRLQYNSDTDQIEYPEGDRFRESDALPQGHVALFIDRFVVPSAYKSVYADPNTWRQHGYMAVWLHVDLPDRDEWVEKSGVEQSLKNELACLLRKSGDSQESCGVFNRISVKEPSLYNKLAYPFAVEIYNGDEKCKQSFVNRLRFERSVDKKKWVSQISKAMEQLPTESLSADVKPRVKNIETLIAEHREALKLKLKPLIIDLLITNPPTDDDDKRSVARCINFLLKSNSIAIAHPETEQPCSIFVNNNGKGLSLFVLKIRDNDQEAKDKRGEPLECTVRSPSVKTADQIELVEAIRRESTNLRRKK